MIGCLFLTTFAMDSSGTSLTLGPLIETGKSLPNTFMRRVREEVALSSLIPEGPTKRDGTITTNKYYS